MTPENQKTAPPRRGLSPFGIVLTAFVIVLIIGMAFGLRSKPKGQDEFEVASTLAEEALAKTTAGESTPAEAGAAETAPKEPKPRCYPPTPEEIDAAKSAGTREATIVTDKGTIIAELYGKEAPLTVANFVKLAEVGFYDDLIFHRIVDQSWFKIIQGGDPRGDGTGDPGYEIELEISDNLRHVEGALAMARGRDKDSGGCQFYITLMDIPQLDGDYAVFGKVVEGLDVAKQIEKGDKIQSITIK